MSMQYDIVVIGAGHNGLTAAAFLAKKGRKVLIVEKREIVGGLAAGEEFHPGYRSPGLLHETNSVRSWVAEDLDLKKHGLRFGSEPRSTFLPQTEGPGLVLWDDPNHAREELTQHSERDAERYGEYREFIGRIAPVVSRMLDQPPPDIFDPGLADLFALGRSGLSLRRLGKRDMMDVLRIAPMCVADYLGEWFESELVKAGLAGPSIFSTFTGPWSPGSNLNHLVDAIQRGPEVVGGPQAFVSALERAAVEAGVEIRTGAEVEGLELKQDRIQGVRLVGGEVVEAKTVAASCDPKQVMLRLLPRGACLLRTEQSMVQFRARGTTAKIHLALDRYPEFSCRPGLEPAVIRTGETLDDLERAFDPVKYRRFSETPMLDIRIPTVEQPELAPAGHHVASILVSFAPYDLEGGWNEEKSAELYRRTIATLERYVPQLEDSIVASEVLSPADLEDRYGLTGGHLHHGEHSIDQRVVRPSPECAHYTTPFEGLFLCGSGSHPGGGLTGAPGGLAAKAILKAT